MNTCHTFTPQIKGNRTCGHWASGTHIVLVLMLQLLHTVTEYSKYMQTQVSKQSTIFVQITPSWIFINIFCSKGDNFIL